MNVHYFKLLQNHYYIITVYYCHDTAHYLFIITVLLLDSYKGTFHYCIIITYFLLPHYVFITTILLPYYYLIATIDCFIITWSLLKLITTCLLQLQPLLPIFITTLLPITPITTILHHPNLQMLDACFCSSSWLFLQTFHSALQQQLASLLMLRGGWFYIDAELDDCFVQNPNFAFKSRMS